MDEIGIIADYRAIMVYDCWKPYFKYEKAEHALCCAHILRELVYAEEVEHRQWVKPLADLGENFFPKEQAEDYSKRYEALLAQGPEANSVQPRKKGQICTPQKANCKAF